MSNFAELTAITHYSFLRGASHPREMVEAAIALGHQGIGIADQNSVAGVVRAHVALREAQEVAVKTTGKRLPFRLIVGARLVFADDTPDIIAYPATRFGWGRLTRLLTTGNRRTEKGSCLLYFDDLAEFHGDLLMIALTSPDQSKQLLNLAGLVGDRLWLGASMPRQGSDERHLAQLQHLADSCNVPLLATNTPLYATPQQRALHDILTCIAEKKTITTAGKQLMANAERHLKSAAEMERLFHTAPGVVGESCKLLERVNFTLDELSYHYPDEPVPDGWTPQAWLEELTWRAARKRHPGGVPKRISDKLDEELTIIAKQEYAPYFLTVYDIVKYARSQKILCQGRGSAANSVVCALLGITSVDPMKHDLLFSRFISEERKEPPDIDVDFEHERREEVIQYIYERYGRHRAGIAATVVHYRPRSAIREVGKALGLSEDVTARLSSTVWGSYASKTSNTRSGEAGFDPDNPEIARLYHLVGQILQFPRHLSQHVGGFILTQDRLDETVPIHNAAMDDRTFIEWDKDDIDALGLMKVDVLALGMLTCIRKCFDLMREHGLGDYALDTVPPEDPETYAMLQKGDSIGVFQVESRAQINMLPRLKPEKFYDLVVQVAIVRPGPIEGDMVHPYLRRRSGVEKAILPSPKPPHDPNELKSVLGETFGVPLFQEQAMKLAIVAADFTPSEANMLRRAMATFRNVGTIHNFREKMIGGMVTRGYEQDFAERCFKQIEGFGSYGFPESHAISFARLVYISSWIKCHHPAVFAAALLNSQPMGFYAPAQIVRDAREHDVEVREVDINASHWNNGLERLPDGTHALRIGMRQIDGFREIWAEQVAATRPFDSIEMLSRRAGLPSRPLRLLADADACRSIGLDRRQALWEVRRIPADTLPLFAAANARELGAEEDPKLPDMTASEHVVADYQSLRLSLKGHPMAFLRERLRSEGVLSCGEVAEAKNGSFAKVAGIVLIRQRPGKGNAIFATLEDERGITNVLIWARLFERYRRAIMAARLMQVEGEVQRSVEGVTHLIGSRVIDRTDDLIHLTEHQHITKTVCPADEATRPQVARGHSHPRDVRIIPKSRDFH